MTSFLVQLLSLLRRNGTDFASSTVQVDFGKIMEVIIDDHNSHVDDGCTRDGGNSRDKNYYSDRCAESGVGRTNT